MNTVTFKGQVLHLEGNMPKVGAPAPDFILTANDLSQRTLRDYAGKALILLTVPSLDTPVCDLEVRQFNADATKLSDKIRIAAVSCDLPFAQKRWCGAAGVSQVETLSDYKERDFGRNYGVLIQELKLLARAIFVIGPDGILRHSQLAPEVSEQPDFLSAWQCIKTLS